MQEEEELLPFSEFEPPVVTVHVGYWDGEEGPKGGFHPCYHSFPAPGPGLYGWLCRAARSGAANKRNGYLNDTSCVFLGLDELFSADSLTNHGGLAQHLASGAGLECYAPCSEAQWPAWFQQNLHSENTATATMDSFCVVTNNEDWPVLYAMATSQVAVQELMEAARRTI
jgi:hypothetical protein